MVHDVLISVGVYSVFGFEVTPATVVAFLTILGFSLYDTIVVFDKVQREHAALSRRPRTPYADIVNLSMNQVLMRSLNTTLAAVLPVLSLLVVGSVMLGADALEDFALALLVGLHHRLLLVDLHRHAAARDAQGARAAVPGAHGRVRQHHGALDARRCDGRRRARLGGVAPRRTASATGRRDGGARPRGYRLRRQLGRPAAALGHPPRPRKKKRR